MKIINYDLSKYKKDILPINILYLDLFSYLKYIE